MYYWGKHGVQRDLRQAVKFYEMGAANGDPQGLFNLGITKLKVDVVLYQVIFVVLRQSLTVHVLLYINVLSLRFSIIRLLRTLP